MQKDLESSESQEIGGLDSLLQLVKCQPSGDFNRGTVVMQTIHLYERRNALPLSRLGISGFHLIVCSSQGYQVRTIFSTTQSRCPRFESESRQISLDVLS